MKAEQPVVSITSVSHAWHYRMNKLLRSGTADDTLKITETWCSVLCSRIGKTLDNQCVRLAGGDFSDESEGVDC